MLSTNPRQKYGGLGFLNSLIKLMMTPDFRQRPTAREAFEHWHEVKSKLDAGITRLRLRNHDASVGDTIVDTLADGIVSLTWLFNEVRPENSKHVIDSSLGLCRNVDRERPA